MHQGCVRSRQRRRGGERRGGGRHRQALGRSGGVLHPRAGHRPRGVPVRPRRVPRPVVRRRRQRLGAGGRSIVAGFQAMFEGRDPTTGELLGRPHGRNAVPAFDVVLRPTKSVSVLYGLGDPATGRAVLAAHHAGLAEAAGYLDEHLGARRGHGGVQHVSGQGLLAVGFDHRTSREGDPAVAHPLWWSPTASRVRTAAGRPWTAGTCTGIGWPRTPSTGPPTSASCPDTGSGVDGGGHPRQPGAPGCRRPSAGVLQAHRPDRAELDRLVADGRERTPRLVKWAVQATRKPKQHEPGHPVWPLAAEAAERGRGRGRPCSGGDRPDNQPRPGPDGRPSKLLASCSIGWPARRG